MLKTKIIAAAVVLACGATGTSEAAYRVTYTQVSGNVVAVGSGSIKLGSLTRNSSFDSFGPQNPFIEPSAQTQVVGANGFNSYDVNLTSAAGAWGTAFGPFNGTGTGDGVYFNRFNTGLSAILGVPVGYVSGAALNSTAQYLSQTFASLGLNVGTYSYSFGTGANADTFTLVVDPTAAVTPTPVAGAAPEPATWGMMILGLGVVGGALRRRRLTTRVSYAV